MFVIIFLYFCYSTLCANFVLNGDHLEISGAGNVTKEQIDMNAPSKLKKITVLNDIKAIMESAFTSCVNLEEIELPYSLEVIEAHAFQSTKLKILCVPAKLRYINFETFLNDKNVLEQYTIDPSNQYYSVYEGCLYNADQTILLSVPTYLKSLLISQSTKIFGESSFTFFRQDTVVVPDTIEEIKSNAFSYCFCNVIFSNNSRLTKISNKGFYRAKIKSFICPPLLKIIQKELFQEATSLINFTIMESSNLERLEDNAFLENNMLELVCLPSTIAFISTSAFSRCPSLQNIIINGTSQFYIINDDCIYSKDLSTLIFIPTSKKSLIIPSQTIEIGSGILQLSMLESFEVSENNTMFSSKNGVLYNKQFTKALAVLGTKEEIHIDSRATNMEDSLFYGLDTINVTFSDDSNLTEIPQKCFGMAKKLKFFKTPPRVTSIGALSFENSGIEVVVISAKVQTLDYGAFRYSKLREVIFESNSNLELISEYCFYILPLTSIVLPANLKSILYSSFAETQIEEITIPKSVNTLGEITFGRIGNLKIVHFEIGSNLKELPNKCFYNCPLLHTIDIPGSVESIGVECFKNCKSLNNVEWKETSSLIYIKSESFSSCGLTTFLVPSTVPSIEASSFYGCQSFTNFELPIESNFSVLNGVLYSKNYSILIVCPYGISSHKISSVTETIAKNAFAYSPSLKNISFEGNLVEEIGEWTFFECTLLSRIEFPFSMKRVLSYAFAGCTKLSVVIFTDDPITNSNNLVSLGGNSFSDCSLLSEVQLGHPTYFKIIDKSTFSGCKLLSCFNFPASVMQVGANAFEGCSSLKNCSIDQNSSLVSIGSACFKGSAIESISLPASLSILENECFSSCLNLKNVFIRSNFDNFSIGEYCFVGCSNLQNIIYCGLNDPGSLSAFSSGKLTVYVLAEYKDVLFCGHSVLPLMSGCGVFPTNQFTIGGNHGINKGLGCLLCLFDDKE